MKSCEIIQIDILSEIVSTFIDKEIWTMYNSDLLRRLHLSLSQLTPLSRRNNQQWRRFLMGNGNGKGMQSD